MADMYFPGGGVVPRPKVTPEILAALQLQATNEQDNRELSAQAEERQAAWQKEAERQAVEESVLAGMSRMRTPIFRPNEVAPVEEVQATPEEPVAGSPLDPLEEQLPTGESDVPPTAEEVRINPYTGQPFKTSQNTGEWQPTPVNPYTGQVMDPYRNVNSEQVLLGGLVTAAPAQRYNPNAETIQNPFADSSLTPQQQSEQVIVQRAARQKAASDKQAEAYKVFGAKWKAAQKWMSDPLVPPEAKAQVQQQMQSELASFAQPNVLDTYMAALAESSVETQVALAKDNYRKAAVARGASTEDAEAIAGMVTINDGRADYAMAERHLDRLDTVWQDKTKREREDQYDQQKSKSALYEQAYRASQTKNPTDIEAYYGLVNRHESRWPLPGPKSDPKQGFSFAAESKRLFPPIEALATPATPTQQGVIDVRVQADIDRANLLLQQARDRGDRNFVIRLRDPNTGTIKTRRAF